MHPFRTYIARYGRLSPEEWEAVEACLQQVDLKAGEILMAQGKVCRHFWFVEEGLLRYYSEADGEERTKFFTVAPYAFTAQKSFTSGLPAQEAIDALEPCRLWALSVEDANDLLRLPGWSAFVRKLVLEVQAYTEALLVDMQTLTAEQRYAKMLEEEPELVRRVSLKHLASYLGIAPQSLSRIRARAAGSRK